MHLELYINFDISIIYVLYLITSFSVNLVGVHCQGRGREFESLFPLQFGIDPKIDSFFINDCNQSKNPSSLAGIFYGENKTYLNLNAENKRCDQTVTCLYFDHQVLTPTLDLIVIIFLIWRVLQ